MAHFAEVDNQGVVLRVLAVRDGEEGISFIEQLGGTWIQTSYNTAGGVHQLGGTPLHKNYACTGYHFDGIGFSPPQPYPSWVKNQDTYLWEAPIPRPAPHDDGLWSWEEDQYNQIGQGWVLIRID